MRSETGSGNRRRAAEPWPDTSCYGDERSEENGGVTLLDRSAAEPYIRHVPVYSIRAAAGRLLESEAATEEGGIEAPGPLREGMFAVRVAGRSMEPTIRDGSIALFVADPAGSPLPGSREGKIVLAQLHEATDPEGGGSYTVKRYHSEKAADESGSWRHHAHRAPVAQPRGPGHRARAGHGGGPVIAEFVAVPNDGSTPSDHNATLQSSPG